MSEMVDRLAVILSEAGYDGCELIYEGGHMRACLDPPCPCRALARKLLAAMREPTYDMVKAGVMKRLGIGTAADLVEAEWREMIDTARDGSQ